MGSMTTYIFPSYSTHSVFSVIGATVTSKAGEKIFAPKEYVKGRRN